MEGVGWRGGKSRARSAVSRRLRGREEGGRKSDFHKVFEEAKWRPWVREREHVGHSRYRGGEKGCQISGKGQVVEGKE